MKTPAVIAFPVSSIGRVLKSFSSHFRRELFCDAAFLTRSMAADGYDSGTPPRHIVVYKDSGCSHQFVRLPPIVAWLPAFPIYLHEAVVQAVQNIVDRFGSFSVFRPVILPYHHQRQRALSCPQNGLQDAS